MGYQRRVHGEFCGSLHSLEAEFIESSIANFNLESKF